jgi:hypothetical protein
LLQGYTRPLLAAAPLSLTHRLLSDLDPILPICYAYKSAADAARYVSSLRELRDFNETDLGSVELLLQHWGRLLQCADFIAAHPSLPEDDRARFQGRIDNEIRCVLLAHAEKLTVDDFWDWTWTIGKLFVHPAFEKVRGGFYSVLDEKLGPLIVQKFEEELDKSNNFDKSLGTTYAYVKTRCEPVWQEAREREEPFRMVVRRVYDTAEKC